MQLVLGQAQGAQGLSGDHQASRSIRPRSINCWPACCSNDEYEPIAAAAAEIAGENLLRLTLTEGKYHQVKRMVAAVSNRVEALHRESVGELSLPADLQPGEWRWLTPVDLQKLGYLRMTLTEMRYIVALARERHFGKAAEACHVSQPTLSVALKKVEGQLGAAALFERTASDVRITALGERIVAQAKRVLDEAVRLEEIADSTGDPLSGQLRVGIIYSIAPYLLPQFIPALHQQAPNDAAVPQGRFHRQPDSRAQGRRARRHRHCAAFCRTRSGRPGGL